MIILVLFSEFNEKDIREVYFFFHFIVFIIYLGLQTTWEANKSYRPPFSSIQI